MARQAEAEGKAVDVYQAGDSTVAALKNKGNSLANSTHLADHSRADCAAHCTGSCPRHPWAKHTWATCDTNPSTTGKEGKTQHRKLCEKRYRGPAGRRSLRPKHRKRQQG